MQLAYAKTIHTFQGASAGPTPEGHQENPVQVIVCDPGTKDFEGRNTGLFYTTLSRPTTMGRRKDHLDSAIFFEGDNMRPERIMNITRAKTGYLFKKAALRKLWVAKLERYNHDSGMSESEKEDVFSYSKTTILNTYEMLAKFET